MFKKIFMMLAVFVVAVQFSVANADVAFPERYREPVIPISVSAETNAENNQVIIKITRRFDAVESYSYKVYQSSTYKILDEGDDIGFFDGNTSTIEFNYEDLKKKNPQSLLLTFETSLSDYRYNSRRPILNNGTYAITFERSKNGKVSAKVNLLR